MTKEITDPGNIESGIIASESKNLAIIDVDNGRIISLETDWGAKGAQLTGLQVQNFIKAGLLNLNNRLINLEDITPAIRAACDGCFVAYHNDWEDEPRIAPYWEWPDIEANTIERGDPALAIGVLVDIPHHEPFVVMAKETSVQWCRKEDNIFAGPEVYDDEGFVFFDGRTNTATILAKLGDKRIFSAASYCNNYTDFIEDEENGLLCGLQHVGTCWMPSFGEAWAIRSHKDAINRCLSVIKGADLIQDWSYWTSSEKSATEAFTVNMGDGFIANESKQNMCNVRPITSYR